MLLIRTLLLLLVFAAGAQAASAAEAWRIVASTGAVTAGAPGVTPVAVDSKQALPVDSWVETGATGRAVLTRGQESVAIGPNSRVMLPALPINGNTQVLQTVGTALYQIGKQKAPHFQVDTPYLAAVVKGTTFTVSVSEGVASVDVTEGLVQVSTPDGADSKDVAPGFTGYVKHAQRDTVIVVPSAAAPGQDAEAAPKGGKSELKGSLKESSNEQGRVVITEAIGEVSLDVKTVSGGLVSGTEPPSGPTKTVSASSGVVSTVSDAVSDTGSDATGASVDAGAGSGVSADASNGAAGAGVGVDVGGGNGVGIGVDVGDSGGGATVGVGVGNGGVGVGVDLGAGGSGGVLGLGLGLGKGKN